MNELPKVEESNVEPSGIHGLPCSLEDSLPSLIAVMVSRPLAVPLLPLFLRGPIPDGFLAQAELAELGAEAVHFRAVRVVFGEEAFFEKQELVLSTVGMVDDGDEETLEVDLDAGEQFGKRGFFEVAVVVEGEFAGIQMDLDEVGLAGIAVEAGGALDIDAEDDREFVEQAAVDCEVALLRIEEAEVELGDGNFQFVLVAGGEHEFAGFFLGVGVAAEERAEVALEAEGKLVEWDFPAELGGGDEDEQILFPALAGGGESRLAEAVDEELKSTG